MKYVVWVKKNDGWWATSTMPKERADILARQLDADGRSFLVVPAPRFNPMED